MSLVIYYKFVVVTLYLGFHVFLVHFVSPSTMEVPYVYSNNLKHLDTTSFSMQFHPGAPLHLHDSRHLLSKDLAYVIQNKMYVEIQTTKHSIHNMINLILYL